MIQFDSKVEFWLTHIQTFKVHSPLYILGNHVLNVDIFEKYVHLRWKYGYCSYVCIEFILLKIENWKYCNNIIFKCMNNAVKPIFNK